MSRRRSGLANDRRRYGCYCENPSFILGIVNGSGSIFLGPLTQIAIPGALQDVGYGATTNTLDDGDVPIPMANMVFNFFGVNYSNNLYWSSNNALVFGTPNPHFESDIYRNLLSAILLGNYDRSLKAFSYTNVINTNYSMTVLLVTFYDYYTNTVSFPTYQYQIRLIKESGGARRQFVEVYVISSPPSPGYSSANISYPSGVDINGHPIDSDGNNIDSTKNSPYNITNGISFLNPCGSTYSTASPAANTSFVFSSDSTGSLWTFTNNSHINV